MAPHQSDTWIGRAIDQYQVLALIGAGGMGIVYRARDTKLERHVALKVLPDEVSHNPECVERLEREARLLASLNHPNIASIYDLKQSEGMHCLVLEYIDGETLAQRLRRGPLPITDALILCRQVAEALEAAHEHGIVHRDVKPGNVMITINGDVKVLDFGLAKVHEVFRAAQNPSDAPTLGAMRSSVGVILGTAAYMSPEQVRGELVDKRTDIWAFGCMLYEMLAGQPAFVGGTVSDTIAMILSREPSWQELPQSTSHSLRRLVRRCLEKDPKRRLHDIADVRIELDEVLARPDSVTGIEREADSAGRSRAMLARRGRLGWLLAAVLAAALIVTLGIMGRYFQPHRTDALAMRFVVPLPASWTLAMSLTNTVGAPVPLAVSPDGQTIAFTARNGSGRAHLWIRSLDSLTPHVLEGTDNASSPFWSPDNRFLGFFADAKLKKIDLSGGRPVAICDAPDNRGGTWSRDGTIVFASSASIAAPLSRGLLKVPASGGMPIAVTALADSETAHIEPVFLPDGRHFLYRALKATETAGQIYVGSIDSMNRTLLLDGASSNAMFSKEHLLFVRDRTLMAQPFDTSRRTLGAEAVPITERIQTRGNPATAVFSASESGVLAFQTTAVPVESQLVWYDRAGSQLSTVGDRAAYFNPELSQDGKRAGVELNDPALETRDIWLFDLSRGVRTRFTFDPAEDTTPVWSPDGTSIVFDSARGGALELYQKAVGGSGGEKILLADRKNKYPSAWSPDGQSILYMVDNGAPTNWDLWVLPVSGDRKPVPFIETPFNDRQGRFSQDQRWVAYVSDESGREEVYVSSFPNARDKVQVSSGGGWWPRWRRDGKELFYLSLDNKLMAASVNGAGVQFETAAVLPLFQARPVIHGTWPYDASADGQRFLVNSAVEDATPGPITLVVNWTALLKKKLE